MAYGMSENLRERESHSADDSWFFFSFGSRVCFWRTETDSRLFLHWHSVAGRVYDYISTTSVQILPSGKVIRRQKRYYITCMADTRYITPWRYRCVVLNFYDFVFTKLDFHSFNVILYEIMLYNNIPVIRNIWCSQFSYFNVTKPSLFYKILKFYVSF